jgi:type IV pilus assembly protein PilQ
MRYLWGRLILWLMLGLLSSISFAATLQHATIVNNQINLTFDETVALLGSRYFPNQHALVVDFSRFDSAVDMRALRHPMLRQVQQTANTSLSRLQFDFQHPITYRIESQPRGYRIVMMAETSSEQVTGSTDTSLRTALKELARKSGIDIAISNAVQGEASLFIRPGTDPKTALRALMAANNLQHKKIGSVWVVEPEKLAPLTPVSKPKPKKDKRPTLFTQIIPLNYANAEQMAKILRSGKHNLLSAHGSISADPRTNSLLINDHRAKVAEIRRLARTLDKPRRQVLIQSKIVIATNDFGKSLGIRFGLAHHGSTSNGVHTGVSGSSTAAQNTLSSTTPYSIQGFNVNLPVDNAYGSVGLMVAKLPFGTLLDLELTASQLEGQSNIVASPSVMTADGAIAYIKQGVQVPYRTTTDNIVDVKFKEALMELRVVPRITPNDFIIMELVVKKDAVGAILCNDCEPSIDTREVKTQVRIKNGETLVIGGIKEEARSNMKEPVPGLSRIPGVGRLFSRKTRSLEKRQLFIFITPSIVEA